MPISRAGCGLGEGSLAAGFEDDELDGLFGLSATRMVTLDLVLVKLRVPVGGSVCRKGLTLPTINSTGPSSLFRGLMMEALESINALVSSIERLVDVGISGADGVYSGGSMAIMLQAMCWVNRSSTELLQMLYAIIWRHRNLRRGHPKFRSK